MLTIKGSSELVSLITFNITKNCRKQLAYLAACVNFVKAVLNYIIMNDLSKIVDTLENRISKLLHSYEKLKQKNLQLEEQHNETQKLLEASQEEVQQWSERCSSLQLANSMLGSDQHKRETKLKINALVREIDQCIGQLSE